MHYPTDRIAYATASGLIRHVQFNTIKITHIPLQYKNIQNKQICVWTIDNCLRNGALNIPLLLIEKSSRLPLNSLSLLYHICRITVNTNVLSTSLNNNSYPSFHVRSMG